MSLPSAAPACQPQARSTVSYPSSTGTAGLPAQQAPLLHAAGPERSCLWLPADLIGRLVDALPMSSMLVAFLVSRAWLEAAGAARSAAKILRWMEELGPAAAVTLAMFDQGLIQVAAFPPRFVGQGLCTLARWQCCLAPHHQQQAFRKLLAAASGLCLAERSRSLCLLAVSLAPVAGSRPEDWSPARLDMLIAAARELPVERQAMIVAPLCGNREDLQGAADGFLAQIAGIVRSWPAHELARPGALFARTIHACVKPGPMTPQIRQQLGHFGFYRLPFLTSQLAAPGRRRAPRSSAARSWRSISTWRKSC
ncbi:MAG: hypothetical protein ABWY05_06645 [Noviherbaspirillum sp.]